MASSATSASFKAEVCVSAFGEKAAEYGADHADGFWTTGPQGDLLDTHDEAGGLLAKTWSLPE